MNHLISIITPSYNQAIFLETTILSVLNQDYPHIEYIIVDGGSTDDSMNIIERYAKHLSWWTSEEDDGQADAIKKGFQHAKGQIVTWLNSDDLYLSSKVLTQVAAYFREYPNVDVITGNGVYIDQNERWTNPIQVNPNHIRENALKYRNGVLQPATFIHKRAWEKIQLNTSFHYVFDWDLWIQLSRQSNWLIVPQVWAGYRWWGKNKTARGDSKRTQEQAELIRQNLGTRSWQFITLWLFTQIFAIAELFPANIEGIVKKLVQSISRLISKFTRRKIPVV